MAAAGAGAVAPGRRRLRPGDVVRLLVGWGTSSGALMVSAAIMPGLSAESAWSYVAVAAVAGVLGLVLRPLLAGLSARIGWTAVVLAALVGQAVVMYLAIRLVPGIHSSFGTALAASWVTAAVGALIAHLTTAGTDDGLVMSLTRRGRRPGEVADPEVDGVVFVQLDGVPYPVLRWAVQAGGVPTIRRWLVSGDYVLREWTPQLPCTTPASQLGILHGTVSGVPAFRWYDRELGRVLVANRPADARIIEERGRDGAGLLWDDGVSVSNLFTGDAPRSLMVMSSTTATRGSLQTRQTLAWFLTSPNGFARSAARAAAEILKERFQARRQVRRRLEPRMRRGWEFAFLRAATNALLCDLNTALVAEEMRKGTKSIYVDYVDYDEVAHHAGMFRPESLACLDGLDRVLASLEALARRAPRRYRIVALSDHGQSQGQPFEDRYGESLGDLCQRLMAQPVQTVDAAVEGWGRAESIAADVRRAGGVGGRLADSVEDHVGRHYDEEPDQDEGAEQAVVLGSGNLGLLYLRGPQRLSTDDLSLRWPGLVDGLTAHPGIGFVAGLDAHGCPWAIGGGGRRNLHSGDVEGRDPLAPFGEHAARVLSRAVLMPEAPDLYVNSAIDRHTGDIAAFEDLVGAHGGLGGDQDSAVLLAPADLATGLPEQIEGADELHRVLVGILESCGHRRAKPIA